MTVAVQITNATGISFPVAEENVTINPTTPIRDIAAQLPQATRVFENLRIDYCCGGWKPIGEACETAGLSFDTVVQMLETAKRETPPNTFDPHTASLIRVTLHILDKHHVFTKAEMTRLDALLKRVIGAHGRNHPELSQVASCFRQLCDDLRPHMFKEEQVLFPYIVELERSIRDKGLRPKAPFGSAANPIRAMGTEHDEAGDLLCRLRSLTNNYTVPADGCFSYQALYEGLEAFEEDLHEHIHLENNILFPRAIEMEAQRNGA
jgi:regulator of cell morphogenesis and NO signaling